jgi:hypothetical protein
MFADDGDPEDLVFARYGQYLEEAVASLSAIARSRSSMP